MTDTPDPTRTVLVERELPYPPEQVWRALTQPNLIAEWLMQTDFTAVEGKRFTMSADWGSVACKVRTIEPCRCLSYSWDTKDLRSIVCWTLTPTQSGTHLRMEQTGFRPEQKAYLNGARAGWTRFIRQLDDLLAQMVGAQSGNAGASQ